MSSLFPLKTPVSILMYHNVGPFPKPKIHKGIYCSAWRFKEQMAMLHWGKYNVISVSEAVDCLFHGKQIPPRAVVLTFDDGSDNFQRYAFPVLKKYGFSSMVYLISGFLGQSTKLWIDDMPEEFQSPLMSAQTVRDLRKEGVDFGSHTCHHVHLTQLGEDAMRSEIGDSKKQLEDILGEEIPHFCFPYGFYNPLTVSAVREAGYLSAVTCESFAANYAKSPFLLPRKHIRYKDKLSDVWWKLNHKNFKPAENPDAVES
jgi:peptidoglycan/xylan/chitin deacetylase (PgdA/CDA1 family)